MSLQIPLSLAICARLLADTELTDIVDDYAGNPAILGRDPVPDDVEGVYVVVRPPFFSEDADTKTNEGVQLTVDIGVYGPTQLDATQGVDRYDDVDRASDRVRASFGRTQPRLSVSGWETTIMRVTGPISAPSDDTMTGRIVSLELTLRQAQSFL